ncbi:SLC13 family permease [Rhizobium sp. TRM95111]|uniref:SLC13 family permease n=1 Tax=Rhizobium alarense TaxID=2846851 RepID=UPI001F3B906F|nr:SLC13 family permease [Rhizobium alarense]MCF3642291.1 SLC13 family permease [Rhizobium alarense]
MSEFHLFATFAIILLTIVAFASDRFSVEAISIGSLSAFLFIFGLFPFLTPDGRLIGADALLSGFGNSALATVIALLIVGQGLFATDALEAPAHFLGRLGGDRPWAAIVIILVITGITSAFLNNTPVVVIFIPILSLVAAQKSITGFHIFMPLSFVTILGGMTTLMGSSTNMIAAGIAEKNGYPVGFFDFTGMGAILALAGTAYVLFVMPRLLGNRMPRAAGEPAAMSGTQFVGEVLLTSGHRFIGMRSQAGFFPGIKDLTPRLLLRRDVPILPPFDEVTLEVGDQLIVTGTRKAFTAAIAKGETGTDRDVATGDGSADVADTAAAGGHYHLVEAVISPGSRYEGRTIQLSGLQPQFGVAVFGVQRKSRMARTALSEIRLEAGDTLLIGGTLDAIHSMRGNHDILLLEHSAEAVPQRRKANLAITIFALVVALSAFDVTPIVVNAILGAAMMIATGCLTLPQAVRAFDRQIYLLIGASIAMATALEATGGAALIATRTVMLFEGASPGVILSALFLVMAALTNILSNNAVAALFIPIALEVARRLQAPPEAFIGAVIFAANCSFATPIGYQTNLLVMGPGHYRFSDFIRAGTPLVALLWLTFSLLAPWYYGL